jgi:hypothetical protein
LNTPIDLVEVVPPSVRSGEELQRLYCQEVALISAPRARPHLDDDGLLWNGRRWVVIPAAQVDVAQQLLDHPDQLVRTGTITSVYMRRGASGHPASIRTMVNRLARRFGEVGLTVHLVRGKGLILEGPEP